MYVTRPLSKYLRDPSALSSPPPEGPNSGVLVIQDEEAVPTFCCGLFKSDRVSWGLPFPQNKNLMVRYTQQTGEHQDVHRNRVLFIPVLNQPLSSNQYYVVERKGKHKGYVCALSPTSPCFVFLWFFFSISSTSLKSSRDLKRHGKIASAGNLTYESPLRFWIKKMGEN